MNYSLTLEEVTKLAKTYNIIPVHTTCIFDLDTPVSLYIKSGAWKKPYSFLLESVTGGENRGRYSYIGLSSQAVVKGKSSSFKFITLENQNQSLNPKQNPLEELEEVEKIEASDPLSALKKVSDKYKLFQPEELSGFYAGLVGFFTYDIIHYYEPIGNNVKFRSKDIKLNPLQMDDMIYVIPKLMIWVDHVEGRIRLIRNIFYQAFSGQQDNNSKISQLYQEALKDIQEAADSMRSDKYQKEYLGLKKPNFDPAFQPKWECNTSTKNYLNAVQKAKNYIRKGDIFQVVLSKRFYRDYSYEPFFLYRSLRATNPSPYMFYLNFPEIVMVGSSPEILIRKEKNKIILRPIAGTIQRGKNASEDEDLSKRLLNDPKEQAEHVMLVDLGRNDVGRIANFGSVMVDEYMVIEKYSHVMHIVSNVVGELQKNKDSFEAIQASFPAGTVSGAPKVRAMQIIEELEQEARGPYAGCIGYFNFNGDMDTAITLRTMWVKNNKVYVQAGGGIVFDSTPEKENEEAFRKASTVFKAVEIFYQGQIQE